MGNNNSIIDGPLGPLAPVWSPSTATGNDVKFRIGKFNAVQREKSKRRRVVCPVHVGGRHRLSVECCAGGRQQHEFVLTERCQRRDALVSDDTPVAVCVREGGKHFAVYKFTPSYAGQPAAAKKTYGKTAKTPLYLYAYVSSKGAVHLITNIEHSTARRQCASLSSGGQALLCDGPEGSDQYYVRNNYQAVIAAWHLQDEFGEGTSVVGKLPSHQDLGFVVCLVMIRGLLGDDNDDIARLGEAYAMSSTEMFDEKSRDDLEDITEEDVTYNYDDDDDVEEEEVEETSSTTASSMADGAGLRYDVVVQRRVPALPTPSALKAH